MGLFFKSKAEKEHEKLELQKQVDEIKTQIKNNNWYRIMVLERFENWFNNESYLSELAAYESYGGVIFTNCRYFLSFYGKCSSKIEVQAPNGNNYQTIYSDSEHELTDFISSNTAKQALVETLAEHLNANCKAVIAEAGHNSQCYYVTVSLR